VGVLQGLSGEVRAAVDQGLNLTHK
jgi:hypothetical protein